MPSIGQDTKRDTLDRFKKLLPVSSKTEKIECLNELSELYMSVNIDSAKTYAKQALKESERINDIQGQAVAYRNLGLVERYKGTDLQAVEKYYGLSLALFIKTQDKREIGRAWSAVAFSKWVLTKFPEAIDAYENALQLSQKTADTGNLASTYRSMSQALLEWGRYSKSLELCMRYKDLTGKENYSVLGQLYSRLGDHETALKYHRQSEVGGHNYLNLGSVFYYKKQYDSALHYYQLFSSHAKVSSAASLSKLYAGLGEIHLALKHPDTALLYLTRALSMHRKAKDQNQVLRVLHIISIAYLETGNYIKAKQNAWELLQSARVTGTPQYTRDANFVLYQVFDLLKRTDSAYTYLKKYIVIKDSLDSELTAQKLDFYKTRDEREKAEARLNILNEEKNLQQQQLKQATLQKNFLVAALAVLLLTGFILFRNISLKRKNEILESKRRQVEMQHKATEFEMHALRSQMNPHFIFNCLSSINRFILKNESEAASDYLTKFSRLIRMVLTNSERELISLEDELEMLRLYLQMERLRFKACFDYNISFQNDIDLESAFIPPLILQPFVENAIWHGLMNKESQGYLSVYVSRENTILRCEITDNGVGRKKAMELKSKSAESRKSLGLKITKERLDLLNSDVNGYASFEIEDLYDNEGHANGTKVILNVKLTEKLKEGSLIS
jgi:tetratricopeptide (TPR) repeat protein